MSNRNQRTAKTGRSRNQRIDYLLNSLTLTARPSAHDPQSPLTLVCSACRAGPFSYDGFSRAVGRGRYKGNTGYCYMTTWSAISQSIAKDACNWCRIIRRTRDGLPTDEFPPAGEDSVEVRLQVSASLWRSNIEISLNRSKAATYDVYANPGV